MHLFFSPCRKGLAFALPLILSGCATFSTDGGFAPVEQAAKQHINKDVIWQRSENDKTMAAQRVQELLRSPLTVDTAGQIALLNNRGLQATFFELGISEAEFVQAGRLPNPGFSFSRIHGGNEIEIERSIVFNLASLLTFPTNRLMAQRHFEETQRTVTAQMLSLAAQTRKAYFAALAADQTVHYMQQVKQAADAGAELAQRMLKAGNFNKLQQAREQSFYADAALNLLRAEQQQIRSREKLTRLMGLTEISYSLPSTLPDLPATPQKSGAMEQIAMSQRLDVQEIMLSTEHLAKNLGLSKTTRFINVLEVGAIRKKFQETPAETGYELSLELPLFDWGEARIAKAEATYMQAVNRTEEVAVNALSEVREAYLMYRSTYEIAKRFHDEILPLKKRVAEENLLRYNGMLIGVFDLLADAREQIISVNSAIEANRDFWMAKADLELTLVGAKESTAASAEERSPAEK